MREEIWAGLKNALERGSSLDQAAESFINAGYNAAEVNEAARSIKEGATSVVAEQDNKQRKSILPIAKKDYILQQQQERQESKGMANMPFVQIQSKAPPEKSVAELQEQSQGQKTLYVPGSEKIPNLVQVYPTTQKFPTTNYIPNGGANSTKTMKLVLLVLLLLILISILLLTVIFWKDIINFVKDFYGNATS